MGNRITNIYQTTFFAYSNDCNNCIHLIIMDNLQVFVLRSQPVSSSISLQQSQVISLSLVASSLHSEWFMCMSSFMDWMQALSTGNRNYQIMENKSTVKVYSYFILSSRTGSKWLSKSQTFHFHTLGLLCHNGCLYVWSLPAFPTP